MREKEITTRMIPALEKKYGSSEVYEFEGKKYLSLGDPYLDSVWINTERPVPVYSCSVLELGEPVDDSGYVRKLFMFWDVIRLGMEDESLACDWEHPADVRDNGATFDVETLS